MDAGSPFVSPIPPRTRHTRRPGLPPAPTAVEPIPAASGCRPHPACRFVTRLKPGCHPPCCRVTEKCRIASVGRRCSPDSIGVPGVTTRVPGRSAGGARQSPAFPRAAKLAAGPDVPADPERNRRNHLTKSCSQGGDQGHCAEDAAGSTIPSCSVELAEPAPARRRATRRLPSAWTSQLVVCVALSNGGSSPGADIGNEVEPGKLNR